MKKDYKLAPEYFKQLEKRFYLVVLPIILFTVLGVIYLSILRLGFSFSVVIVALLLILCVVFSFRKSLTRQKQSWASYQLTIDEDTIRRTQNGYVSVDISKDNVSGIIEYPGGSIVVKAEMQNKQIVIPAFLERYLDVRSLLNQWHPIDIQPSHNKTNIAILFIVAMLSIVGFGIVMLGQDKIMVTVVGLIFIAISIWSFIYTKSNSNFDKRTQRGVRWIILPMVLILIRICLVILES